MLVVEWGHGPRKQRIEYAELDALLDRIASEARPNEKPQDVQVTVEGAGTLGIVVGADWSVLNHIPSDLEPPYLVSLGREQSDDLVVFYVAGDHYSETRRRNIISPGRRPSPAVRRRVSWRPVG